ncbi:MAG: hypothetical protein QG635_890 [Bacteroidota bacterium]|nr:hypothetical protein [Bacteroidota bacterium]
MMKGKIYNVFEDVSIESKIAETKSGIVEYFLTDEEQKDKSVLLASHGGIGGVDQSRILLDWADKSKYRLLCVSRPGYLLTPLESGISLEQQADMFAALLDYLDIKKACIISISAGGPPAYTFAIKYPERLWGLIAIDSVSGYYDIPETAGPITAMLFTSNLGQKLIKLIGERKPDWFADELLHAEAYFTKKQIKEHKDYIMNNPKLLKYLKAFLYCMNPYNPRKPGTDNDMEIFRKLTHIEVEKIMTPALIIHGTHDSDVKFYDGVYAYEQIKGAKKYWIEEGSHFCFYLNKDAENAQKFADDFMDSLPKQ